MPRGTQRLFVVAGMATVPSRVPILGPVIRSLIDQVDALGIYLNGHPNVPELLHHPKIEWQSSLLTDLGDAGDASKFYWAMNRPGCVHLTVDDDIIYPPDYVNRLLRGLRDHPGCVVGIHGFRFMDPITSFYKSRHPRFHCVQALPRDAQVHVLGTGTTAFWSNVLEIGSETFPRPNMADLWLAIAAKKQGVPMICLSRPARWLRPLEPPGGTIYEHYQANGDAVQTAAAQAAGPWRKLKSW